MVYVTNADGFQHILAKALLYHKVNITDVSWQSTFLCPNLHVVEIHPAGQIVLKFTTGRDEHKSELVPCPSLVLP